jgi:hypothetical protein
VPHIAPSSPAPPIQPDASPPESATHIGGEEVEYLRAEVQNQLQTIAVLVSDKMALSGSLERLSGISTSASSHSENRDAKDHDIFPMAGAKEAEYLLRDEQATSKGFRERILQLENETQQHSATIEELSQRERKFEEMCREQVRITINS